MSQQSGGCLGSIGVWMLIVFCYLPAAAVSWAVWPSMTPTQFAVRALVFGTLIALVLFWLVIRPLFRR